MWSPAPSPRADGELLGGYFWPSNVPAFPAVFAFEELFRQRGFARCETSDFEEGVEKVAIFGESASGEAFHVARQCSSGRWSSKMGDYADIEHELDAVAGGLYGAVQVLMARRSEDVIEVSGPRASELLIIRR